MNYGTSGTIGGGEFRQFGGLSSYEIDDEYAVTIDLRFRMATNGVLMVAEANNEPIIANSIAPFDK